MLRPTSHGRCGTYTNRPRGTPRPTLVDPDLGTEHYTLDRYLDRAWPKTRPWLLIPVTAADDLEGVRRRIREKAFTPRAVATVKPEILDEDLNADRRWPVLAVAYR